MLSLFVGLTLTPDRQDASSMVTAGATANTTVKNSRASRESGLLCSHSHGESIAPQKTNRVDPTPTHAHALCTMRVGVCMCVRVRVYVCVYRLGG